MTDDTVTSVDNADDLEAFEKDFYNKTPVEDIEDVEDDGEDVVEDDQDEEEDANLGEDNPPASDDDNEDEDPDEEESEDEPEDKGKKARKSAQERINELTAKAREAERREAAALKKLEELTASVEKDTTEDKTPLRDMLPDNAPNPDALDKEGEPVYPLGEFDPAYIRDLTRFTMEEEKARIKEEMEKERIADEMKQARETIQQTWNERLVEAEKEIPEIRENISVITETFADLDPAYGEYLATAIMVSDAGPALMHYLSQNIGEAQQIVASGPTAAIFALGKLEAKLMTPAPTEEVKKRNTTKVSKAPEPPANTTQGRGGRFSVNPDTDDLDAFEKVFYKK